MGGGGGEGWFGGLALSQVQLASLRETKYLGFGLKQLARRGSPGATNGKGGGVTILRETKI